MGEDIKLVEEVLKGNIDSFNILINKYEHIVQRFIYNMIKDKEASEDIAQEVFITVYNKLYSYNREYKLSSWIFQIAKNKTIDYMRKYKRVYESNIEDLIELSSKDYSPEATLEYKETKKRVQQFIQGLDIEDKQILILRYTEGFTFSTISEILNLNESSVKRHYYNTKEKYKEYIKLTEKRCKA